jgi:hypothetical protein
MTQPAPPAAIDQPRARTSTLLLLALLLAVGVFGRCAFFEFVNWDDRNLLADNPKFNPPVLGTIAAFILPRNADENLYIPMTQFTWGLIAALGQMSHPDSTGSLLNPWFFHGANVALHLCCIAMVFAILRWFFEDIPAWLGAMLFAVHPMQVETIAWASGLRDLLSALFGLICLHQFVLCRLKKSQRRWFVATAALLLALLSKPSAVALPLEAVVVDLLLLRTRPMATLISLWFWFLLCIPIVLITRHVQPIVWPIASPLLWRPLVAWDAIAFYGSKLVYPLQLVFDYGRTPAAVLSAGWRWLWLLPTAWVVILWIVRKAAPRAIAGTAVALAGIVPVLGLVPFEAQAYSTVSDHYLYASMLGVAMVFAALVQAGNRAGIKAPVLAMALVLVIACAVLSFSYSSVWANNFSLFPYALSRNPLSSNAHGGYAAALATAGDLPDAITEYRTAEQLNPRNGMAIMGLASALLSEGDANGAADEYMKVMQVYRSQSNFNPALGAQVELMVARRLVKRGDYANAAAALEQARSWYPTLPDIDQMLANVQQLARTATTSPSTIP